MSLAARTAALGHSRATVMGGRGGKIELRVSDMPEVDRALRCALPLIRVDPEFPEYPGIGASCFLARYKGRLLGFTAWHVVKDMTLPGGVAVPRSLSRTLGFIRFAYAAGPKNLRELDRKTDSDADDVAVLLAADSQTLGEDVHPFDFDNEQFADIRKGRIGSILAAHGYPVGGQDIDYDARIFNSKAYIVPGLYRGPYAGLHTMEANFSAFGANGMCGSPVVLCARLDQGWQAGIAGMVLRGGPTVVHFLQTLTLLAHAQKFVEMLPAGF